MDWDFENFMDKELWEICEEAERIERQKQEEREIAKIISQLQAEKISEIEELKQEEEQKTIEEQEQAQTEEVIKTKEGETEEISEVEQETIEEIKEKNLEFDESKKEAKQEISQVVRTDDFKQIQSEADKAKKVKIFDSELAIEIVKSDKFKEDLILSLKDASRRNRRYIDIIRDLRASETTEKYTRKKNKYLDVILTLKGKKEVLKYLPPGAYPVVYEDFHLRTIHYDVGPVRSQKVLEGDLWIAINKEHKLYAVVIKDLQYDLAIPFPSVFNVVFLIVYPDNVEFFVVDLYNNTQFPNTEFPIYAKCDKYCRWMPEPVLACIESVIRENIEYYQKYKQKQLQTQEFVEEDKLLKNVLNKRIREFLSGFYEWNKYVQDTYLVPYILYHSVDYLFPSCFKDKFRLINGWVKFFPKPTFLPKQIHIKNRYELMRIPEGIYPIIRYYPQKRNIVFALTPNTEVVFEINSLTEELLIGRKNKPSPFLDDLDLAIVWNETLTIYRLTDFDYDFHQTLSLPEQYKFSSVYWRIGSEEDEHMYYLPEPLFFILMGEKNKTREGGPEQIFVADLILNSQKGWEEWNNWVKLIANKYNSIKVDNEKLKVIEPYELLSAWYIKEIKKHYLGPYKYEYELVLIHMKYDEPYKFRTDLDLELTENNVGKAFLTAWADGTIACWILDARL